MEIEFDRLQLPRSPVFTKEYISENFIVLDSLFHLSDIKSQELRCSCLLSALTPEISELVLCVIPKSSSDDHKLAIPKGVKRADSQLGSVHGLRCVQNHRVNNQMKTDNDDMASTIIIIETEFDTVQFRTYNREQSKELPFIACDSNPKRREKKSCSPEFVLATHKGRAETWSDNSSKTVSTNTTQNTTTRSTRQLQHRATSLHLASIPIVGLYNLELVQHKGRTSLASETIKSSKAIKHKFSVSRKTLQTVDIFQFSRLLCINMLSNAAISRARSTTRYMQ
ncbi:unnamed protein product [Hymenolepis diminuta]|uniref:Uncharacterized protein n=1 Tax=Hymenolepis diminuta TaxID=6216 RepID=A0A564YAJ3_HYMDI|nr:unnamed protein product [Hymenolepis diminuta]